MSETNDLAVPELTLGWRMQMAMRKAGYSRADIAGKMHVTGSTVGRWISDRDKTGVKRIYLERWAELCAVPYEWLAGELFVDPTVEAQPVPHPRRRASDIEQEGRGVTDRYTAGALACHEHDGVSPLLVLS